MKSRSHEISAVLGRVLSQLRERDYERLALHEPRFSANAQLKVADCIESGWVSSVGAYVDSFEKQLGSYLDGRHAVACVNGTAALQVALRIVGVQSQDEVIVPSLTFVATASAVCHLGAIPHFVDVEDLTLGIDPIALRRHLESISLVRADGCWNRSTGRRIRAVVGVHILGHPCQVDPLLDLCNEFKLQFVEDAAEALGSEDKGRKAAALAPIAALSFNGNKILTTGGGGAIICQNAEDAKWAKHLTTTAKKAHPWKFEHDAIAYNYRMPNMNAALGCSQLEDLGPALVKKRLLAEFYEEQFAGIPGITFIKEPPQSRSNYWLVGVRLDPDIDLDTVIADCHQQNFLVRPLWSPIHLQAPYIDFPRMELPRTLELTQSILNLPSSPFLAERIGRTQGVMK